MALLYNGIISYSHIIFSGWCHINNWYYNNLSLQLCPTWDTLASDSNKFFCPLQSDNTENYAPQKLFLNFQISYHNAVDSTTNIFFKFPSGETIDLEMK